ncbi:MAG: MBL fold metallo-hydrolase [Chthoniobacteraceae bacterium]
MSSFSFTNLTGALEIGSNCYFIETGGQRILLDAGYHPKKAGNDGLPRLDLVKDDSVDAIMMSHAHQDHVGSLPVAMRRHPRAPAFMTDATRQLGEIMLHNSVNVMTAEQAAGAEAPPLFTHREADIVAKRWMARPLNQKFDLHGERVGPAEVADVTFEFFDAGHILGSAGTLIRSGGRTLFYAGDVQFDDQNISPGASFPDFAKEPCDVMIMESTYGGRAKPDGFTRAGETERLATAIEAVFARGGCVLMPLFALGKTQEFLSLFHGLRTRGRLRRDCPIYIGGLGAKLTEVYAKLARKTPRLQPNLDLLNDVAPFVVSGKNIAELRMGPRRIFALSSGMMVEKTLSNVFARQFLSRPENAIFFVGYADPESPAGKLRAMGAGGKISLGADHPEETVRCEVGAFNFSAHASRESIRAYVKRTKPRKLIFVHGDPESCGWLANAAREDLPETEVLSPVPGVRTEL